MSRAGGPPEARRRRRSPGGPWSLEIQIHPADIRRRVRYLFLSRRQLTLLSLAALLYLAGAGARRRRGAGGDRAA